VWSFSTIINYPIQYGFCESIGSHSSRTIMLQEIELLFQNIPSDASFNTIKDAIINENILNKKSISGRNKTFSFLKRMYGLDDSIPLYRVFRYLFTHYEKEHPTLTLLYALARDKSLRISADYILSLDCGTQARKDDLIQTLTQNLDGSFTDKTLKSMAENLLSSWTQSGHLIGKGKKNRTKSTSGPASFTFALYLGTLIGLGGVMLMRSPFISILDLSDTERDELFHSASVMGLISYKSAGGVIEITISDQIHSLGGV
jgi:hypothetical protein